MPSAPARLVADDQLDAVNAGDVSFRIDVSAFSTGSDAISRTEAASTAVQTHILKVQFTQPQHGYVRAVSVQDEQAAIGMARGLAEGSGQETAECAAKVDVISPVDYVQSISTHYGTPTSQTCLCAAVAISVLK
jgi:hypothetical protein